MTHDERISSYIDNELSAEQEQEFLISLAASDGLRKSFRSELVLKKVLHHDEASMNPPRRLRSAVFATLGLGIAAGTASKANAAQLVGGRSFVKSLFATKVSTLITAAGISVSALAGYGIHSITTPVEHVATVAMVHAPVPSTAKAPVLNTIPSQSALESISASAATPAVHHASHVRHYVIQSNQTSLNPKPVAGGGTISVEPPTIIKQH